MANAKVTLELENKMSGPLKSILGDLKGLTDDLKKIGVKSSDLDKLSKGFSSIANQSATAAAGATKLSTSLRKLDSSRADDLAASLDKVSREATDASADMLRLQRAIKTAGSASELKILNDRLRVVQRNLSTSALNAAKLGAGIRGLDAGNVTQLSRQLTSVSKTLSTSVVAAETQITTLKKLTTTTAVLAKTTERASTATGTLAKSTQRASAVTATSAKNTQRATAATNGLTRANNTATKSANRASAAIGKQGIQLRQIVQLSRTAALALTALFAAQRIGSAVSGLLTVASDVKTLEIRTNTLAQAFGDVSNRFELLTETANEAGVQVRTLVDVYNRAALASDSLGLSSDQMTKFLNNVAKAGVASGASAVNLKAGLIQLSQALSAGTVRAEEFNSILENIPIVATVVARTLGTTVGALRRRVLEGNLSSATFVEGILGSTDQINKLFAPLAGTLNAQLARLSNTFRGFVKEVVEDSGLLDSAADAIENLTASIGDGDFDFSELASGLGDFIEQASNNLPAIAEAFNGLVKAGANFVNSIVIMVDNISRLSAAVEIVESRLRELFSVLESITNAPGFAVIAEAVTGVGRALPSVTTLFLDLVDAVKTVEQEIAKAESIEKLGNQIDRVSQKILKIKVDKNGEKDAAGLTKTIELLTERIEQLNKLEILQGAGPSENRIQEVIAQIRQEESDLGITIPVFFERSSDQLRQDAIDQIKQEGRDQDGPQQAAERASEALNDTFSKLIENRGDELIVLQEQLSRASASIAKDIDLGVLKEGTDDIRDARLEIDGLKKGVIDLAAELGGIEVDIAIRGLSKEDQEEQANIATKLKEIEAERDEITKDRIRSEIRLAEAERGGTTPKEAALEADNLKRIIGLIDKKTAAIEELNKKTAAAAQVTELTAKLESRRATLSLANSARADSSAGATGFSEAQIAELRADVKLFEKKLFNAKAFNKERLKLQGELVSKQDILDREQLSKSSKAQAAAIKKNLTAEKKKLSAKFSAFKSELARETSLLKKELSKQQRIITNAEAKLKDNATGVENAENFLAEGRGGTAADRISGQLSEEQRRGRQSTDVTDVASSLDNQVNLSREGKEAIQGDIDSFRQLRDAALSAAKAKEIAADGGIAGFRAARDDIKRAQSAAESLEILERKKRGFQAAGDRASRKRIKLGKELAAVQEASIAKATAAIKPLVEQIAAAAEKTDLLVTGLNEIKGVTTGEVEIKNIEKVLADLQRVTELLALVKNESLTTSERVAEVLERQNGGATDKAASSAATGAVSGTVDVAKNAATLTESEKEDLALAIFDDPSLEAEATKAGKIVKESIEKEVTKAKPEAKVLVNSAEVDTKLQQLDGANTTSTHTIIVKTIREGVPSFSNVPTGGSGGGSSAPKTPSSSPKSPTFTPIPFTPGDTSFRDNAPIITPGIDGSNAQNQAAFDNLGGPKLSNSQFFDLNQIINDDFRPQFRHGGLFRGKGTGTSDSNTIGISDKEFIMQASAVKGFGVPFMNAVNQGRPSKRQLPSGVKGLPAGGSSMTPTTINFPGAPPIQVMASNQSLNAMKSAARRQGQKTGVRR